MRGAAACELGLTIVAVEEVVHVEVNIHALGYLIQHLEVHLRPRDAVELARLDRVVRGQEASAMVGAEPQRDLVADVIDARIGRHRIETGDLSDRIRDERDGAAGTVVALGGHPGVVGEPAEAGPESRQESELLRVV